MDKSVFTELEDARDKLKSMQARLEDATSARKDCEERVQLSSEIIVESSRFEVKLRDLFGEDMSGTHEVLYIAEKLLGKFLPDLSKHMEAQGVHVSMFAVTWLVTLYVREFPFDLVARVWDCFLVEGWKVVYRVMLSLLEHSSKDILGLQFEEILHYLRALPSKVNGQAIMAGSLKIALKRKHIQKYAIEWRQNADGG